MPETKTNTYGKFYNYGSFFLLSKIYFKFSIGLLLKHGSGPTFFGPKKRLKCGHTYRPDFVFCYNTIRIVKNLINDVY